jgi:hypothetical protein
MNELIKRFPVRASTCGDNWTVWIDPVFFSVESWSYDENLNRRRLEEEPMANVFEGQPDARQSDDPEMPVSRFRPRYRALSDDEKALHDDIKDAYAAVERMIDLLPAGRYRALAMTALEASCMWSIKELTSNK